MSAIETPERAVAAYATRPRWRIVGRKFGRKNPKRPPAPITLRTSPIAVGPPPRSSATNAGRTTPLGPASAAFTIANSRIVIQSHGTRGTYRHPSRTWTITDGFRSLGRGGEGPA